MAHTGGGVRLARSQSTANPIAAQVTTVAGDTVFVLLLKVVGAVDRTGGAPTYNGRVLESAGPPQKAVTAPEAGCELWYLDDPPIGTFTLSVPNAGGLQIAGTVVAAQAGVADGASRLRGVSLANGTSANPAPGPIPCEPGDFIISITANGATTWAPSAQVGTVITNADDGAHGEGSQYQLVSSSGPVNLGWTFATSDDWGAIAAAFREVRVRRIAKQARLAGTHETNALQIANERYFQATLDIDTTDLTDPAASWKVDLYKSLDGVNFTFDGSTNTEFGEPGRTRLPMVRIRMVAGTLMTNYWVQGRITLSRDMNAGAILEMG